MLVYTNRYSALAPSVVPVYTWSAGAEEAECYVGQQLSNSCADK